MFFLASHSNLKPFYLLIGFSLLSNVNLTRDTKVAIAHSQVDMQFIFKLFQMSFLFDLLFICHNQWQTV